MEKLSVKSLQIGDWVKISHRNKIGKIYRIDEANGKGNGHAAVIDGDYSESDLEPIPLEKIHLVKNGFEVRDGTDDMEFFYNDCYEVSVMFDDGYEIYKENGEVFEEIPPSIYLAIEFAEKSLRMPIEYVHELQQAMRIIGCDKEIEL